MLTIQIYIASGTHWHSIYINWRQDTYRFLSQPSLPLCSHSVFPLFPRHWVMAIRNSLTGQFLRRSSVAGARLMSSSSSWFRSIEPAPKDPILGVTEAFLADQSPNKVNVGVVSFSLLSPFPLNFRAFFCSENLKRN